MEEEQEQKERGGYIARFFAFLTGRSKQASTQEIEYDEHVWTSPRNAMLIVQRITDLLCETDNANAGFYRQNASTYIKALEELDAAFNEVIAGAKRKTIVFGDRFPFRYFADAYGLEYCAAFPGCSTETEASAATVAFLINKIRSEQIPVVFHIELSNERMANAISAETGARKLLLHACHNISKRDFEAGLGYLDLMRANVENLRQALH
jgi:zinc transport system substrate-binding protein